MNGNERRQIILYELEEYQGPISASEFASKFNVSRQSIVGDIALLRASGYPIMAGAKGYSLPQKDRSETLVMIHSEEQTQEELAIFIKHNIRVLDVTVEHAVYGYLKGQLNIASKHDLTEFLDRDPHLLSSLTGGIHSHTVQFQSIEDLIEAKKELDALGFLYKD